MAIAFVEVKSGDKPSASFWIQGGVNHSPGDLLVAGLVSLEDTTFTPALAGWTLVSKITCTDTGVTLHVFYKFAFPGETDQFTFNTTPNASGAIFIAVYSGVDDVQTIEADIGEQPPDINASCIDGGSSSQVVPGLVTTVANTVILTFIGTDGGANWTPDAGMIERADLNLTSDVHFAEEAIAAVGATGTRTHVFSTTTKYVALMLALRPLAAFAGPAFVAVASTPNQASSTSWPVTTPTHSTGDLLLAGLFVNSDTVVVTPPAGWTLVKATVCTGLTSLHVFRKIAGASEPATQNFTMSPAVVGAHLMASYSGVDGTTPLEASIGSQPPDINSSCIITPAHQVPGITTTVANVRAVTFVLGQSGSRWTHDVTTLERADVQSAGAVTDAHLADFGQEAVGATGTRIHAYNVGSQKYAAIMVGLKPSALSVVALQSVLPFDAQGFIFGSQTLPAEMLRRISETPSLPMETNATVLVVGSQLLPIQFLAGVSTMRPGLAIEWGGTTPIATASKLPIDVLERLALTGQMPISFVRGVAMQTDALPVEFLQGVTIDPRVEVEFFGTARVTLAPNLEIEFVTGTTAPTILPVDARGITLLTASPTLPIESLLKLVMPQILPVEAAGEDLALLLVFNVRRPLEEGAELPLSFLVVPVFVASDVLPITFTVSSILGRTLALSFRVLPDKIVTLFDDDIQFPFGRADKN